MHDFLVAVFRPLDGALDHALRGRADGVHVLEADVGGHHKLPCILVACTPQLQAQIQFGNTPRHLAGQIGEIGAVLQFVLNQLMQCIDVFFNGLRTLGIGLNILLIAGQ
ncbi:hypothetical protein SDC9_84636 [bioreactor metagenome]|uniref:Uncharacterized protein n=1 Tax=bioreactor metagenome TaxID=1076179 RepID=A0A644ZH49_9ZZZZ